jgi:hypothetical protein
MKREAEQNAGAMKRLTQIELSIIELEDDSLLDFADIFSGKLETAIAHARSSTSSALSRTGWGKAFSRREH